MSVAKKYIFTVIIPIMIAAGSVVLSNSSQARIKCWENSEGIRECGEKVPPEYAQKGHKKINSQGITVEESARAKTREELAEERRLAAIKQEEDARQAEIEMQNRILLDTYSNVDDIQMTRDGTLAALESNIKLAIKRNEKIRPNLDKLTKAAAEAELAGKQPSEDLLKDIKSLSRQIKNNDEYIADTRLEQSAIEKEYAEKIERFLRLTGKSK